MKQPKTKEEIEERAREICSDFKSFTSGVRVLQLILRSADGGHTNNTKVKKYISKSSDEFYDLSLIHISEPTRPY